MSRITKSIAESVAKQLTEKKWSEITELKSSLGKLCTEIQESKIPKEVLSLFQIHPKYFDVSTHVYFSGQGLNNYNRVYFDNEIPLPSQTTSITPKEAEKVIKLQDKIEDKTKAYKELKNQIEIALFNLRTYNNVEKEFPEAFKILPVSKVNSQLMVNVKSIRCQLDKSTC